MKKTKITLEVTNENLGSVVTILNSLKEGLIEKMEVQSIGTSNIREPKTRYQPKEKKVIKEQEQSELEKMGKYIDPVEFKKRLGKR